MMMESNSKKFYITTAIPYVNARPHLGHALEFVQADAIRRYRDTMRDETLLLSGADENALKNVQAAAEANMPIQEFVDQNADLFRDLLAKLNVKCDVFQKGSDQTHHFKSSQELWRRCNEAGDIYKKTYTGLYCVGCEAFYGADELNERGECFEHPGKKLETVSEENYFFRLSKYQEKLIQLLESDTLKISPSNRKNEILSFLKNPLEDISISRTNERAKNWGVPVPGDPAQRMYVWFDALNIYQSGVGFGWNEKEYTKWWPCDMHVIGKGIIRFHTVYWPAFLLSAKLELPKSLFVHGYITIEGQKMSKSLGNVIDPFGLIEKYGSDPLRYYLLREIPSGEDGDFSSAKFEERYNGDLANGIGNLIARVATLGEKISPLQTPEDKFISQLIQPEKESYRAHMETCRVDLALGKVWEIISNVDKEINDDKPWALKDEEEKKFHVAKYAFAIDIIREMLEPFLPETAAKIHEQFTCKGSSIEIKKAGNLFPRL